MSSAGAPYDVVVIGGGNAGLCAAFTARELGARVLVLECAPAAYINYACNEAEKGSNIKILHISSVGRFGRMWLSGSEAEILTARNAAVKALEGLEGRPEK